MSEACQTWGGEERRANPQHLSDEQIEVIAERAAEKAVNKLTDDFYKSVGKGVISKLLVIVGVLVAALWAWLNAKGFLKF